MKRTSALDLKVSVEPAPNGLAAAFSVFEAMNRSGIRYCLWKSNIRLPQGLLGQTDLDVLVDREQAGLFAQVLSGCGLKRFHAPPGRDYPAVENYLGFDDATGKLFHLHVHYQLVLGEQFAKNYRLPLERHLLDSEYFAQGVRIVAPELEIIVLCIRILLKYRDRDVVKDVLGLHSPNIPPTFVKEIEWLLVQVTEERMSAALSALSDVVPNDLIRTFLGIATSRRRSGLALYRLRNRVRGEFSPFQRSDAFKAGLRYFHGLWGRRGSPHSSSITKMTAPAGGLTLAIIGADGAGKTTVTELIARWLRWKIDARTYYLGSKKPSRSAMFYYFVYRAFRRAARIADGHLPAGRLVEFLGWLRDLPLCLHHIAVAHQRHSRHLEGSRLAMAGSVVIYDRFPVAVLNTRKPLDQEMDGPRVAEVARGRRDPLIRALIRAEQDLYDSIRPPDYVVVLEVSPEISARRKPDHDPVALAAKAQTIHGLVESIQADLPGVRLLRIDANLALEEVAARLKQDIWNLL
jgi:hypothetical protein